MRESTSGRPADRMLSDAVVLTVVYSVVLVALGSAFNGRVDSRDQFDASSRSGVTSRVRGLRLLG